jgi:hypothetical protein
MMVTDTMHQFKPSYNMHRGFGAYDFIRGQTTTTTGRCGRSPKRFSTGR